MSDDIENKKKNVIQLPDSTRFLRCALCGGNIEASINDLKMEPAVLRTASEESDQKFWFCGTCYSSRLLDIQKLMSRQFSSSANFGGKEAIKLMVGDDPIYRVYVSKKANRFGEKLKVMYWKSREFGLFGVISLVKGDSERPFCFNLKGFRQNEFKLSLDYIKSHYKNEYGDLIEDKSFRAKIAPFKSARLPLFRSRLVGMDLDFLIYDNDPKISIKIGFVELAFDKIDIEDISMMMIASSSYLKFGDGSLLRSYKKIRELEGPTEQMRSVRILSKKEAIATHLLSKLPFSISGSAELVTMSAGHSSIVLPLFDFMDIATTLRSFLDIFNSKMDEGKKIEKLRRERYLWLSSFVNINFKFIMRDFGWYFDPGSLLDAA